MTRLQIGLVFDVSCRSWIAYVTITSLRETYVNFVCDNNVDGV